MLAFGLSIALFVFWGVLGYAFLAVLKIRRSSVQNMLLAPVIGVSVTLLPVFWLNRAGLPIAHFGVVLAIVLLLISIGTLWYFRPIFPLKQYWPFAAVLLLALFLTGRPLLEFGFNWLSYANDDMANYVLEATRRLNHGFFDIPNTGQFASGSDYSLPYWFFYLSVISARTGVEMLIAWTSSLTGLAPLKIFMPLILALHLVLISSAGALAHHARRLRPVALMTCVLLSFSALTSLGALYQLIAQVSGLGLLIGCMTVLLRPFTDVPERLNLRHGVLVALLVSAFSITYPELTPFLGLGFILYWMLGLIRRRLVLRPLLGVFAIAIPLAFIVLGEYVLMFVGFLQNQVTAGLTPNSIIASLFPYYLIPSGLAYLWGFQSLSHLSTEPLLSITISFGGLLLFITIVFAGWQTWQLNPSASMTVVMFVLGMRLFMQSGDFGLFKLAMFIQPFMLATVAFTCFRLAKRGVWQVTPLLVLALAGLAVQTSYVETSRGLVGASGGLTEISGASQLRIFDEFETLVSQVDPRFVVLDTSNVSLAKLQTTLLRGRESAFPSRDFFGGLVAKTPRYEWLRSSIPKAAVALRASWNQRFVNAGFILQNNSSPVPTNKFTTDNMQPPSIKFDDVYLITTMPRLNLFNRSQYGLFEERNFIAFPWSQVENHLIFITSQLGEHYYLPTNRPQVSFYQLEPDPYFIGNTMAGIGRHFLFQVVNPSPQTRFVLDLTTTLKSDGKNELPPAIAIGAERQQFPMVGRGSARVFSPPLTPQMILGRPYFGIDMGVDGVRFQENRTGLMALYGTDSLLDPRYLTGFARNISLVSEQQYDRMTPPSQVVNFPTDLANPNLEYSGLYEDGWVAETAYLSLTQPETASPLVIRGSVPMIYDPSFSTELIVMVDGQEIARKTLVPGDFELRAIVPSETGRRRIDLRFSNLQQLPAPDNRPSAALLKFVGFETQLMP